MIPRWNSVIHNIKAFVQSLDELITHRFKRNKQGYIPIVKPNKGRYRGYYRHQARKLYRKLVNKLKYKKRGRGESVFGSLTNEFGDRLKTSRIDTSITRIGARVIAYLTKIYMKKYYMELLDTLELE